MFQYDSVTVCSARCIQQWFINCEYEENVLSDVLCPIIRKQLSKNILKGRKDARFPYLILMFEPDAALSEGEDVLYVLLNIVQHLLPSIPILLVAIYEKDSTN